MAKENLTEKPELEITKNKPKANFRSDNIFATIWENQLKIGDKTIKKMSVQFKKSWKDDKGEWQNTQSFNITDLPMLAKLANDVHTVLTIGDRTE